MKTINPEYVNMGGDHATIYEGPSGHEMAFYMDMFEPNLDRWGRRLRRKLGKLLFDDVFPNVEDKEKETQEFFASIGIETDER